MRLVRLSIAVMLGFAVGFSASASSAETWPHRTVRVILPNPGGVAIDVIARLFTDRLSQRWGNAIIVENIPGADGTLAAREFVTRRDNHTLLYSFPGLITINPLSYNKLPYDPTRDLMPIASTSDNFLAIAVSANLKISTLRELIEVARTRPVQLNWAATPGLPHFAFAGLQKRAGLDFVHVPYRDFNQALVDLAEGRIDAAASGLAPMLPHANSGKMKLVAFINPERTAVAPTVPTLVELGYAEFSFRAVTGFFGWRDMPAQLRERIAADIRDIASDPVVKERLSKMGSAALGSTPVGFTEMIEDQRLKVVAIDRLLKSR